MEPTLVDRFMPTADVAERHEILIHAPADLVFDVAEHFDIQSIPIVRAIFWLRARVLGSRGATAWPRARGLVAETTSMGWGVLAREPARAFVAGAVAQPWLANVVFTPVPAGRFAAFDEPDQVKILWTLEADPAGADSTRFATETRAVATDDVARRKFRRYWRTFGVGILMIRWLLLPAVRREAERRYRSTFHSPVAGHGQAAQ